MADVDVVREVERAVNEAIDRNRGTERIIIAILITLVVTGLTLIVHAVLIGQWAFAVPGALTELAIGFPIRSLVKLHKENIRLQIMPQWIRLAGSDAAERKMAMEFFRIIMAEITS